MFLALKTTPILVLAVVLARQQPPHARQARLHLQEGAGVRSGGALLSATGGQMQAALCQGCVMRYDGCMHLGFAGCQDSAVAATRRRCKTMVERGTYLVCDEQRLVALEDLMRLCQVARVWDYNARLTLPHTRKILEAHTLPVTNPKPEQSRQLVPRDPAQAASK